MVGSEHGFCWSSIPTIENEPFKADGGLVINGPVRSTPGFSPQNSTEALYGEGTVAADGERAPGSAIRGGSSFRGIGGSSFRARESLLSMKSTREMEISSRTRSQAPGLGTIDASGEGADGESGGSELSRQSSLNSMGGGGGGLVRGGSALRGRQASGRSKLTAARRGSVNGVPVVWVPDALAHKCVRCGSAFGVFYRKHHCRSCGRVFCAECSPLRRAPVPAGARKPAKGHNKRVRR